MAEKNLSKDDLAEVFSNVFDSDRDDGNVAEGLFAIARSIRYLADTLKSKEER